MEYLSIFFLGIFSVILTIRYKRFCLGDFIEIRWNHQPMLFIAIVGLFCLCAIVCLFNVLAMFSRAVLSDECLKILNTIASSSFCFVFLAIFIMVKKITIKKKIYTWEENPFIRSLFVVAAFLLSFSFLKDLLALFF